MSAYFLKHHRDFKKPLKLSQNISVINASAFMGCSNLLYINIPDAITVIYSSAFQNCNKVKQISKVEQVTCKMFYTDYDCINCKTDM